MEERLERYLWRMLDNAIVLARIGRVEDVGIVDVKTFEEAGVPTDDRGVVVYLAGGAEYKITIERHGE